MTTSAFGTAAPSRSPLPAAGIIAEKNWPFIPMCKPTRRQVPRRELLQLSSHLFSRRALTH